MFSWLGNYMNLGSKHSKQIQSYSLIISEKYKFGESANGRCSFLLADRCYHTKGLIDLSNNWLSKGTGGSHWQRQLVSHSISQSLAETFSHLIRQSVAETFSHSIRQSVAEAVPHEQTVSGRQAVEEAVNQ